MLYWFCSRADKPAAAAASSDLATGSVVRAEAPKRPPSVSRPAGVAVAPAPGASWPAGKGDARVVLPATAPTAAVANALETEQIKTMNAARARSDKEEVLRQGRLLVASPHADVRAEAVSALGWIGKAALPELSKMLTDTSEEVATDALDQWTMAVNEIEDDTQRGAMLAQGMRALSSEDALNGLALLFAQLPSDIALRSLATVIASDNAAAATAAREQYAFMTQTPWTSAKDAESWIEAHVAK